MDLLATRDIAIASYTIAIGIKFADENIELGEILDFDDKAYESDNHDKILFVVPELGREAENFANQQRIKVLQVRETDAILSVVSSPVKKKRKKQPFKFKSK
ncbi:hypothetical protein ACFLYB_01875 [Chloroflexota bacterium]